MADRAGAVAGGRGLRGLEHLHRARLVVHAFQVTTPKWQGRPPLRIVALGDLHVGSPHIDLAKLEEVVARANALHPDLVVLLGDYVIQGVVGGHHVEFAETARRLAALRAPHGVFAVIGNHDWWEDGDRITRLLQQGGITVLENGSAQTHGYWIAGIADNTTRHPDPVGTVFRIPAGDPVIAITHDPAVFVDMPGRVALTLAAHTHGGQIYLPFIGALITPGHAPRRWAWGHIHEGGRDLVVTAGIGTSIIPVRFNMPPEIMVVTLSAPP
jgi:predicted MPP superfamily phosphohydrolase